MPQYLQERQIGYGAAVLEAFALQVGVLLPGERPDELKEQPGFAHAGLPHDAHDLALALSGL
jgi:hypothetical protein